MSEIVDMKSTLAPKDKKPVDYEENLGGVGNKQEQLIALIRRLQAEAKNAKLKVMPSTKMAQFLKVYKGDHYPEMEFSPYTKWKARQAINYTGGAIDFITSFMLEQSPHPFCIPPDDKQEPITDILQAALDDVWEENDMDGLQMEEYATTAFVMGTAIAKVYWDPLARENEGSIMIDLIDPRDIDIDPTSHGNIKKARYMIWEKNVPWEEVVRRFPSYQKIVSESLSAGDAYQLESGSPKQVFFNAQATETWDIAMFSPVTPTGVYDNSTYNPLTQYPTKVKVVEAWLRDMTMIQRKNEETGEKETVYKYTNCIRLVTIVGNHVVQDTSTPYPYMKNFPFVVYLDKPLPFSAWGLGTVSQVWPSNMTLNFAKSMEMDQYRMMGNSGWIVDKDAGVKLTQLTNAPGMIITKEKGSIVEKIEGSPPNPGLKETVRDSIQEIGTLSGANDVNVGKPTKGMRSEKQQVDLKDSAQGPLRQKLLRLKKAVGEMGKDILALIQQFYTDVRLIRIQGDYGQATYLKFNNNMMDGRWKIRVESMPSSGATRQARLDQALKLYGMDLLDKQSVLSILDWPNRDKVLKKMADQEKAYMQAVSQGQAKAKTGKKTPKAVGKEGV
jgi:hypothetical protein